MHVTYRPAGAASSVRLRHFSRSRIFLAICMLAAQTAVATHAAELNLDSSTPAHEVSATETVSSIRVADGIGASITGNTLIYTDAASAFSLGASTTSADTSVSLDMRRLDTFIFDNPGQAFRVGGTATGNGYATRGLLVLADNNLITTSHFGIGDVARDSAGGASRNFGDVYLGTTNVIHADSIHIGAQNAQGTLRFLSNLTEAQLTLRGTAGGDSRVAQWLIGATDQSAINGTAGTVDLSGGSVDARVDQLIIAASGIDAAATGYLTIGAGLLDANSITLGSGDNSNADGRLSIQSGTVLVERLLLGQKTGVGGNVSAIIDLKDGGTLRAGRIEAGAGEATRIINWDDGIIGNQVDNQDMYIDAIDIRLGDAGTHTFQIDGMPAIATVDATLSDANTVDGSAALYKTGSGTLLLNAENTYSGATTVNDGTLAVHGALLNSDTIVNSGGVLAGSGSVRNVKLTDGGAISNSMGTLTVDGDLSFDAGSIYRVVANQAHDTHLIDVSGNLSIDGTLDIKAGSGNYERDRHFTILTSGGEQSGSFSEVRNDLAFLDATVNYGENDVTLDLRRNDTSFTSVSHTANQHAVATALDSLATLSVPLATDVIDAVTALSADQARSAFDAIGGAGLATARRAAPAFSNGLQRQLHARMADVRAAQLAERGISDKPLLLAANAYPASLIADSQQSQQSQFSLASNAAGGPLNANGHGLWLRAQGNLQDTGSDGNAASSRSTASAISAGFDTRINDDLLVGVALSHGSNHLKVADHERGDTNANAIAFYGSYASGAWDLFGAASVTHASHNMRRQIAFGSIDRTTHANFGSNVVAVSGEASYAIPMDGWILQPTGGLSISYHSFDGFTERGADSLNLQVAGEKLSSARTQLGIKALIPAGKLQWQPRLIWAHEFGNINVPLSAQLQDTGINFQVRDVATPRDALLAGLTLSSQTSRQVALFADIQGEVGRRQSDLGLLLGVQVSW